MGLTYTNIDFLQAFVRNLDDIPESSRRAAQNIAQNVEATVKSRVASSIFLGGNWSNKPYSSNPIKAYKLGNAVVSGKGMGKELRINGILIDRNDWYWGEWDRKKKGISLSSGRSSGEGGGFHGGNPGRPAPVFIPGYRAWRVEYNSLSGNVDLSFKGNMLDNFSVDVVKTRGSNQYGGNFEFKFDVEEPFGKVADITHYYRNWIEVTEEEINQAIIEAGASLSNILLK